MMTMPAAQNPVDRKSVYIAAGLVSGCGALMFNVMPVFTAAMAESLHFGNQQLGDIIAFFNIGFTLSALTSVFWARRIGWRAGAGFAVLAAAGALAAMTAKDDYVMIGGLAACVGIAMGMLYAIVMAVLGMSDNPDRAFGLKLGLETLPGAILLFLMPVYIMPDYGFAGVVYSMAAMVALLGLAVFYLPGHGLNGQGAKNRGAKVQETGLLQQDQRRRIVLPLLALASSLVFFVGISASWTFLDLLASEKSLPHDAVGTVLAIAFVICGLGGFIAAALEDRIGRIPPVIGIIILNLAGLWLLAHFTGIAGYALGSMLFLFSVNFTLAYTFGLTAEVDDRGRLITLSAASLSIGAIAGPATAGRLIEAAGYDMALGFSALCSLIALALYLIVIRLAGKERRAAP